MKRRLFQIWIVLILGVLLVILFGCASSSPSRFYLINPMDVNNPEMKPSADDRCPSIGVGPIRIPDYLDRPQIVTQGAAGEIALAEFDRWGEPVKYNLIRVFAKNLSILLCTHTVAFFPWRGEIPIDYRIEMEILHLNGSLGGNVTLEAWWMILSGDGKRMLVSKKSKFIEPTAGQNYQALVSAQSRNLEALSRDIAAAIKILSQ